MRLKLLLLSHKRLASKRVRSRMWGHRTPRKIVPLKREKKPMCQKETGRLIKRSLPSALRKESGKKGQARCAVRSPRFSPKKNRKDWGGISKGLAVILPRLKCVFMDKGKKNLEELMSLATEERGGSGRHQMKESEDPHALLSLSQ